jgi:hypothetical protein
MTEYEKKVNLANKLIDESWTIKDIHRFSTIFPFTNVNIGGYFPLFDFKDKSFLTIGSSCDPIINAAYLGCAEQTLIDINPFTKEYFWLKKACLMVLDRKEFKNYFCYRNYFPHLVDNRNALNLESFEKITPHLRIFDYESYLFWKILFSKYKGEQIRRNLFTLDEENGNVLEKTNLYLRDDNSYTKAREAMRAVVPKIIESDIYKYDDFGSYDNINLANLAQFARTSKDLVNFKCLVDKLADHLNIDGTMLVAYLFDTVKNTKYENNYPIVFNLPVTIELLKEYSSEFVTFTSPTGILWEDDRKPDSAIVFRKQLKIEK